MCNPHYNKRVTNKKTMFDSSLRPIYDGKVLANETAINNPVVKAALFEMSKRNFEPQRINNYGVWSVSYTHLTLPTICSV